MATFQKTNINSSTSNENCIDRGLQKSNSESILERPSGGQPSNRPPVKVDSSFFKTCKIVASGVDSLSLSLIPGWRNTSTLEYLAGLKEKAQIENDIVEGVLKPDNDCEPWKFNIRSHGVRAYSYLLDGKDYFIKIFNSVKPAQRPGITIEIRSETLWANGPVHAVEYILDVLEGVGANILAIKPSRIDLCADIRMDASLWTPLIKNYAVTRAKLKNSWEYGSEFTGLSIGRGHISARLYDKVREIKQKSKKFWMFDIWGIKEDELSEDEKIIRVEFQLRREVIKQLIDCDIFNTLEYLDKIWGYCSQEWLKFQDSPGEHHTKRHNLFWWDTIQNGFQGIQSPYPFCKKKSF
ncbi:hypothetical protein [Desulfobacula sp.]|uniref:hypothetical protein n=1 Tax=Desulfobacula sp. TaxID=2593537 RepID=UPI00260B9660|nr:hypothetical protein [Desulfobacula sp.]